MFKSLTVVMAIGSHLTLLLGSGQTINIMLPSFKILTYLYAKGRNEPS